MGCGLLLLSILRQPLPAENTSLLACLDQRNGWYLAGFLRPRLNIYKGFSRPLANVISCHWLKISVGTTFFCLSIVPIKPRDWTLVLPDSQPRCKVGSSLDLHLSTSQTYAVPMIPLNSRCIVLPHLVPFSTLYKNKKGIQSTPTEVILEPTIRLACLASAIRQNRNSSIRPLYNIASKNHPWYPILLGKSLHNLVLQRIHELSTVGHVLICQLRLLEPSYRWFHFLKERAHVELVLMKMTGPVLIWITFTCKGLPQLVQPSFLLGNHL